MKTDHSYRRYQLNARLPEIIIWLISMLVFTLLLTRFPMNAPNARGHDIDAPFFRSGEQQVCQLWNEVHRSGQSMVVLRK